MTVTQRDVVIDTALANVSLKYSNETFIADQILPVVKVAKQSGKYFTYDKSNLRIDKTLRAAGSPSNEVDYNLTLGGLFYADDHALKGFVEREIVEQAEVSLNPEIDETETITEKLLLDREAAAAALLTNASNITQNTTLSGTAQWSDYANSDPIGDIRTARTTIHQNTFKKANTLVLSKPVYDVLVDHPAIIERIKYSQLGIVTEELMARLFQVDKVLIGEAGSNTANEGQADSLGYVWGKHALVAYVAPQVKLKMLTLGLTFTYKTRIVEKWWDTDRKGTYIRVGDDYYTQVIVAKECGYLIRNAIA